ncbi:winged helix-turn-helix transcriptional regulator [Massilia sp. TSP1-1-2]|uniref:winged helix-turn-helix transcriptional regulator n=1 Tax=unclassified Massilia TaxID=2609279 RepID=UPI003CECCFF6
MSVPKPGQPVRGSHTGRPIMALLDLLGRRWAMRIIWELRGAPLTFRQLRERCDAMSPTVLNQRLHELRDTSIVETAASGGYSLSPAGVSLLQAMMPLLKWSEDWQQMLGETGNENAVTEEQSRA